MAHLLHKYHSSALFLGIGMLMLFSFCAPAYASDAPATPTFRSTSPFGINQTIKEPATVNINGIHQGTIYKPFSSNHPYADLNPGSGSGNGSGENVGIPDWGDTMSEPLPITDGTLFLLLIAATMITIIAIKQRKQKLQSITTINNNNPTQHMTTRKQTYQSFFQKLFLLLALVCVAGQVSAEGVPSKIYFRPGTTNFSRGRDMNNGKDYTEVFWIKNGYTAMAIHNPTTDETKYIAQGRTKEEIMTGDNISNRFLSMDVLEGYTQIAAYRLAYISSHGGGKYGYADWDRSNTSSKISNRIPVKDKEPHFIDIPIDGKNLLVHYEGYWNHWYWAYYLPKNNDVCIYFANTGDWSKVKMLTGKDIYTFPTSEFTSISGTKLRYLSLAGNEYGYTHYGFINSSSDNLSKGWNAGLIPPVNCKDNAHYAFNGTRKDGDNTVTANATYKSTYGITVDKLSDNLIADRIKDAPNYTGLREDLLKGINLFTPAKSTNGSAVNKTSITSWQDLNHTHTVTVEEGGKLNYGTTWLTGANSSDSDTWANQTGTITFQAAYTASVTLRAIPNDGYVFLGFYDAEKNEMLSRGVQEPYNSYPITHKYTYDAPNSAQKIIAKFVKGNSTRFFQVRTMIYNGGLTASLDGGTFTMTHSGGITYTHAKVGFHDMYVSDAPVTFEATPKSGFEFIGWFNYDADNVTLINHGQLIILRTPRNTKIRLLQYLLQLTMQKNRT